jgi:hypothetical protein
MANPKKAIAALMPPAIDCGEGASVLPMTLAMWAALERIESPLITGKPAKDTMDLLPSLYLLTHGAAEILSGNLLAKAYEWADTVSPLVMERIRRACDEQITVVTDVIPEGGKKKLQTAGSPRSSTTSRPPTTGRSKKSSGKPRSRHLRSSAAKKL